MKRRAFLARLAGGLAAAPAVLHLAGCVADYGDDDGGDTGGANNPGGAAAAQFMVVNSDQSGHQHSFFIKCSHASSDGWTYQATGAHTHSVNLSRAQLQEIFSGKQVVVQTTDGHPHTWTIQMPAAQCASSTGAQSSGSGTGAGNGAGGGYGY